MDLLLQRQLSVIRQLRKSEPTIDVQKLFDEVIAFLNNSANDRNDGLHLLAVICYELAGFAAFKSFNDVKIMNHPFFLILSNTFLMLLTKLTFVSLTKEEEQCFDGISLFISALCLYKNKISTCFYTDNNEKLDPNNQEIFQILSYEKIFFTQLFIDKFVRILKNDIAEKEYGSYDIRYKVFDRILRILIKSSDIHANTILDAIVQCVQSNIYLNLYKTINLREPNLTPKQLFFIYQCPRFIRLCSHHRQNDISDSLAKIILPYTTDIFEKNLPIALERISVLLPKGTLEESGAKLQAIAWYMEFLNHLALTQSTTRTFFGDMYTGKTVVDQVIGILKTESLIESVKGNAEVYHADVSLVSYSLILLYNLSYELKTRDRAQEKGLRGVCKKLFNATDKTIQYAARTLYRILAEPNIDALHSPNQIARSHLFIIGCTIDDEYLTYHGIQLDGVLTNLEKIVSNDEVKEEITNDGEGIPLLARCVYEPNFDFDTIQRPALRILDAVSFASASAVQQIKENDLLMNYIENLTKKFNEEPDKISIENRILWKVQEDDYVLKQDNSKKRTSDIVRESLDEKKAINQYVAGDHSIKLTNENSFEIFGIMVSYCQAEKALAEKIYHRLKASGFYRVIFDAENKHSWSPQAMAEAIEQSAIVIMCFSNGYQNSNACRLEAAYTDKRKRPIIPVKVEYTYAPTGWLEKMIDMEEIIDFTTDFNTAYAKLIDEIAHG